MPRAPRFSYTGRYGPLPEATWNFTRVPDNEIVACCLWEYARESRTLALASAVHRMRRRKFRNDDESEPTKEQRGAWAAEDARTQRQVKRTRFNYNRFLQLYRDSDFGHLGFYDLLRTSIDNARPFQSIPKPTRRYLVSKLAEASILEPLTESFVCDLELLWKENSAELLEIRSRVRDPSDDSEDAALFDRSKSIVGQFTEEKLTDRTATVAFTIDFSRFADAEIETAFRRWLLAKRPRRWHKPVTIFPTAPRRGRKTNDYRVALERLAIMRLLNQLPPSELRTEIPVAWKLYGHKAQDFRREIRAAVRFFRDRFPFLPPRERPESELRFAIWWRPLQKDLAKLEAKQGRK